MVSPTKATRGNFCPGEHQQDRRLRSGSPHSAGRRRSQLRTALRFFGLYKNTPTPASRRRALPQKAPGSRRAPAPEPLGAAGVGEAAGLGRAGPSTGRHNPGRRFAPPAPARRAVPPPGVAHAQCARGAEWAPPCLPLPGSGERRLGGACGGRRCWRQRFTHRLR